MQTRHWACNRLRNDISCNCGVVLRDHNDVIEFNCCNGLLNQDGLSALTVKIKSKKCLAPGITIKNKNPGSNSQYEVSAVLKLSFHFSRRKHYNLLIGLLID